MHPQTPSTGHDKWLCYRYSYCIICVEKTVENRGTEAEVDFVGKYTTPVGLSVSDGVPFILSEFCFIIWQVIFIEGGQYSM